MRILPVLTLLISAAVVPAPRAAATAAPTHLPPFAVAYREAAVRMLAAGGPYAAWAAQGRRFLFFDPAGDGLAAEVFGDLGTATRIAVLVPGVGTDLQNFEQFVRGGPVLPRPTAPEWRCRRRFLAYRETANGGNPGEPKCAASAARARGRLDRCRAQAADCESPSHPG